MAVFIAGCHEPSHVFKEQSSWLEFLDDSAILVYEPSTLIENGKLLAGGTECLTRRAADHAVNAPPACKFLSRECPDVGVEYGSVKEIPVTICGDVALVRLKCSGERGFKLGQ